MREPVPSVGPALIEGNGAPKLALGARPVPTLATRIRDWQTIRAISDSELCKRFAGLGSTKTFKRILEGDLAELDSDRWVIEYEQVITLMDLEATTADQDEPVYDDIWHVTAARLAAQDAM